MPSYILRNLPPDLWARFKSRSEQEGIPMRALMLKLIELYASGQIAVQATQPTECDHQHACGRICLLHKGHGGHHKDAEGIHWAP
jgi:hypothetical protein